MLDIKLIRSNPEKIKEALEKRHVKVEVDKILELDSCRRSLTAELDETRAEQNKRSKGGPKEPDELRELKKLKEKVKGLEEELKNVEQEFESAMYTLPNIPFDEVPTGKDEKDNQVLREVGKKPKFDFEPLSYIDLGEKLDWVDMERAAKVSGARFGYLKHEAPLLEFALINFTLERLTDSKFINKVAKKNKLTVPTKSFIPLVPPVMIKPEAFRAMGKLDPGQEEERYFLPKDELYLIGSAEHTTGAMHWEEILPAENLPHRHIAFSTAFRREAGSYGKDTRGLFRVHQFDKLEMFSFVKPEESRAEHDLFLALQEEMMQELKIPYRAMLICAGDMVWTDAKQYDLESWFPSQNTYRETHSTSNSTDFQSRRLKVRFKNKKQEMKFVHTINGTAFAIGRSMLAIMENYQTKSGSVKIPKALHKYMFGIKEIKARK
ncbi:MAG: serine--tRNA ligase [Candidatus Yanofskybacteria bacterium RIFCSPHIGHO2_02_FULL_43_15c]|uniref:Serine--tRNA ligase n=1 Tax=Candidatus Yanofskybacteria bacterium RIFCSPHIGHO2_02_FULL_43_15c TaxID=1802679 RepID=A0A1F8FK36_9BACT|nr:MAG: serine--tRNA ligase [Candidatus Yanofskybacteria bacterium RIFCSPHIGHO2_02_FULL_43_15c]